jgi:hypothetical protein
MIDARAVHRPNRPETQARSGAAPLSAALIATTASAWWALRLLGIDNGQALE